MELRDNWRNLNWRDWIARLDERRKVSGLDRLRDVMLGEYDSLRAFHCTRLVDWKPIAIEGLKAWSPDELRQMAQIEFRARWPRERIEAAIRYANPDHRGGRFYAFRDPARMLEFWRRGGMNFSAKGSEFLDAIAFHLGDLDHPLRMQSAEGMVFAIDIPFDALSEDTLDTVVIEMALTLLCLSIGNPDDWPMPWFEYETCSSSASIPGSRVVAVATLPDAPTDSIVGINDLQWRHF